jgi:hypothetical protein
MDLVFMGLVLKRGTAKKSGTAKAGLVLRGVF